MHSNDKTLGCPVCGYAEFEAFDNYGLTTFEICPCCGIQSGYSYGENADDERFLALRKTWVFEKNGQWHSKTTNEPVGWSCEKQLKEAKMTD